MKIKFWGVRGSIPTPLNTDQIRDKFLKLIAHIPDPILHDTNKLENYLKQTTPVEAGVIGGNTSCIEVRADNKILIFDMGSGIKALGNYLVKNDQNKQGLEIHIFLSHTHWDHIIGFPFFTPAFFPNNRLYFYSAHPNLKERLEIQQDFRFFPVALEHMPASKEFIQLQHNSTLELGAIKISNIPLYHPGGSFGYRVECEDKKFVYATDSEYKNLDRDSTRHNIEFFRDADVLVFDAQYTFEEAIHKEDWGHSSALVGVDFAVEANVKKLVLFHHEPERNDFEIYDILKRSVDFRKINFPESGLEIMLATEGLELVI